MYLEHFGLTEYPFGITPDTSYVFSATAHQEALNTLLIAIESGEGFIKITGEIGTGKTLLCRRFVSQLEKSGALVAYIPNPQLEPRTLLLAIAEELGIALPNDELEFHLIKALHAALLERARAGQRVVVCLDEAQAIPLPTLEHLRLLSNLETEKTKLMQLVFFGQPELDDHLADPSVRQLRQRIAFEYRLHGLSHLEVGQYLVHRLRVAGSRQEQLFTRTAVRRLHKASRGTPRVVNILAHKALLATFGEGGQQVKGHHVLMAVRDSPGIAHAIGWWS
jgi:MSHA biogenesis protein MshM